MAADSTVFLRRDPATKQWVTVPIADPAEDSLVVWRAGDGEIDLVKLGSGFTLGADISAGGGTKILESIDFGNEQNYVEKTVSNAAITATSHIIPVLIAAEEAAIQGINVGVVSISEGSCVIYGGAPNRASGIFNLQITVL